MPTPLLFSNVPFWSFLLLISILTFNINCQQALPKSERDGWALQVGAGNTYGGNIGLLAERQFILINKLRITPYFSTGIGEAANDSLNNRSFWYGITTGCNLEYGHKHRIIFGPQVESQILLGTSLDLKKRELLSISLILGYKGTADFGLIWQVYIGDIYIQDPTIISQKYFHYSHLGIGLGYKF